MSSWMNNKILEMYKKKLFYQEINTFIIKKGAVFIFYQDIKNFKIDYE